MKRVIFLYSLLSGCLLIPVLSLAEDISETIQKKAVEVKALKLGMGKYFLAHRLTPAQKKIAKQNPQAVSESKKWTLKFIDRDVSVVVDRKSGYIIGIYKRMKNASRQDVKAMVGDLMLKYEDPTLMAHDKLIYWAYDKQGKISRESFQAARETGGLEPLAIVKFSSTQSILREPAEHGTSQKHSKGNLSAKDKKKNKPAKDETADIYVLITSGPLASLFMAQHR